LLRRARLRSRRRRGGRFVITRADLDETRRSLGIVAPVEIRLTRYGDRTCGRLIGFRDNAWIVGLDTYLSPRVASLTLWHELMHICQAQQAGGIGRFDEVVLREALAARVVGPKVARPRCDRSLGMSNAMTGRRAMPHYGPVRDASRLPAISGHGLAWTARVCRPFKCVGRPAATLE
jgi:hypothetical protein